MRASASSALIRVLFFLGYTVEKFLSNCLGFPAGDESDQAVGEHEINQLFQHFVVNGFIVVEWCNDGCVDSFNCMRVLQCQVSGLNIIASRG